MKKPGVAEMLEILKRENARENADVLRQKVAPAERVTEVTALDGTKLPLSRMLEARFAFAGRWENAVVGMTWLSGRDMASPRQWKEQVAIRYEYWETSAPRLPPSKVALFAIDASDGNETYLVWKKRNEPELYEYVGASEKVHRNLEAYLHYWLEDVLHLAGKDEPPSGDLGTYLRDPKTRLDVWVGGLERWGQPILVRAAVAAAEMALSKVPRKRRAELAALLERAREWALDPRGEMPRAFRSEIGNATPSAPEVEGVHAWNAMHAICAAAKSAVAVHIENPPVIYEDAVREQLLALRGRAAGEVAAKLNGAGLRTPRGSKWNRETAQNAIKRFECTLEFAHSSASAAASHAVRALGAASEARVRRAVRDALAEKPATAKKAARAKRRGKAR